MKPTKRKLSLRAQTLRNLSPGELGRVGGGYSSAAATMCSTQKDTNCIPTFNFYCDSQSCDPYTAGMCSNSC